MPSEISLRFFQTAFSIDDIQFSQKERTGFSPALLLNNPIL